MKKAFIQTYGCQMNEHDSRRMETILIREGYVISNEMRHADLILINTCSVRKNPENKVYSLLGRLSRIKKRKEGLILDDTLVVGCARLGADNFVVKAGKLSEVKLFDFGKALHCLIIPGKMHFAEEEFLEQFS